MHRKSSVIKKSAKGEEVMEENTDGRKKQQSVDMGDESDHRSDLCATGSDADVSFSSVTAVATGWMFDFLFVSFCRHFKEGKLAEFNKIMSTFQNLSKCECLKGKLHKEKVLIVAFLSRVIHGEQLDVDFEEDNSVTPLMSAAKIWPSLERTVADENLFKNVNALLLVQSVATPLKNGQSASSVLRWFENSLECTQNFQVKLAKIAAQKDPHHPIFTNFSFDCLLETVRSFVDTYLEKNPSDYLLKAATETVQSSGNSKYFQDVVSQESSCSETTSASVNKSLRRKRRLLPTKRIDVWKPDSCKKLTLSVRKIPKDQLPKIGCYESEDEPFVSKRRKKTRQKWTNQQDKNLKDGVSCHGVGNWGRILNDYDFEGRTGVMLKDRWRTLLRAHEVG